MDALVGYTGFVGSNLCASRGFDACYNSKNITDAFGTRPDALFFCGVRAEKFLANSDPQKDRASIDEACGNISRISPKNVVLISTIDVYKTPVGVTEDDDPTAEGLAPYGANRLALERFVEESFDDRLIIRLPGLFGKGLKKNFLFDLINVIPPMIKTDRYEGLDTKLLDCFYLSSDNGFRKLRSSLDAQEKKTLRRYFESCGFNALSFTDSRALFQMFNLAHLSELIDAARGLGIKKLNVSVEPVSAEEIYRYVKGGEFVNLIAEHPPVYDFRSLRAEELGGKDGYLYSKGSSLSEMKAFADSFKAVTV